MQLVLLERQSPFGLLDEKDGDVGRGHGGEKPPGPGREFLREGYFLDASTSLDAKRWLRPLVENDPLLLRGMVFDRHIGNCQARHAVNLLRGLPIDPTLSRHRLRRLQDPDPLVAANDTFERTSAVSLESHVSQPSRRLDFDSIGRTL